MGKPRRPTHQVQHKTKIGFVTWLVHHTLMRMALVIIVAAGLSLTVYSLLSA